ncbi:MAG TPA: DNA polymerase III subunit gamma/tau, partial [Pseudobdellovibrionaceae bacterium]|nr:DNA polymerase III subunit gamma/tau [Pseudobdellovibrionaceae bacterium]
MSYQVIARKWRPQTFADLVGQTHITQTLANALKTGRVHHALLFTGPRGTGKTSSARILAKSLRCPNAVDFIPCNTCTSCVEIAQSRSMDVQELDAASNNSVDDVRKLLDGVMSAPSSGRWKIYIIDEVHMLSTSAFNALLKTLEEPPAHVMFILATTEVHKIPETILSRCLRFDFKRISTRTVTDRLKTICDAEGIKADEDALWLIARQGDGSMRDSLSLLDQVITFTSGQITKEIVTRILGLTDRGLLFETLNQLVARDPHGMLKVLEGLGQSGLEPRLFVNELLETLRNVLVIRISGAGMTGILDLPDSEMKFLAEIGSQMTEEETHFLFDMAL